MSSFSKIECKANKLKKLVTKKGLFGPASLVVKNILNKSKNAGFKKTLMTKNDFFNDYDLDSLARELKSCLSEGVLRNTTDIVQDIKSIQYREAESIIKVSENLIKNDYRLYGHYRINFFSEKFSWKKDPITNYNWPDQYSSYVVKDDNFQGTDIKTIWEISRFQYLSDLAIAYVLTDKNEFALFAKDLLISWIEENKFLQGPHWVLAIEPSIRLLNWCIYLPLLQIYQYFDQQSIKAFTRSIIEHLIFIRENLEYSLFKENNHYLSNITALIMARLLFPSSQWAIDCTDFAINEFQNEIKNQFEESGINFEGSLSYHRLSSELSIVGVELIKRIRSDIPQDVTQRLKNMADFTSFYTGPGDDIPLIGDNDSAILLNFFPGQATNHHKYLTYLYDIALMREREACNFNETLCALPFKKIKSSGNTAIPNSCRTNHNDLQAKSFNGLVVGMNDRNGIFFNTFHYSHGHTHNDKLAIYPVIDGKLLFIDRGSFSYTGYPEKRHMDRASASHNGPVINGWEQNRTWKHEIFYISEDAKCDSNFNLGKDTLIIKGYHKGYNRYIPSMKVFREVEWNTAKRTMAITDWVECSKTDETFFFSWNFLINPFWVSDLEDRTLYLRNGKQVLSYQYEDRVDLKLEQSSYCPNYMQELSCQALIGTGIAKSGERIKFLLQY